MRLPVLHRAALPLALAASALLVVGAANPAAAAPATSPQPAASEAGPTTINGYRSVGYFQATSPTGRDYQVADVLRTGAIANLTHLNYAFGNVGTDGTCGISADPTKGDAADDFVDKVSAKNSVDGKADTKKQALAGNFNQLRKLEAVSPSTKVLISLGGWTWSDNFSKAASTAAGREKLVSSCIDTYLKGNLPVIDGRGGPGAAAGIFDGIDIDWEWPVVGGNDPTKTSPDDAADLVALMQEFRTELDAYGRTTGKHYLLSAFAPASGWTASQGGWENPALFAAVDYLNVQGYDLTGGWVPNETGNQGNLFPETDADGNPINYGLSVSGSMQMYVDAGIAPAKLNMGLAAYGRGWVGVKDGSKAWQPATGVAPGPVEAGTDWYSDLRNLGTAYFDPKAGASWRYDGDQWWSLDDPTSVAFKADYLATKGYGGAMWWDVTGDYKNELTGALGSSLRAATPGPSISSSCATPWYASSVYTKGDVVSSDGVEYAAKWWTRNQAPDGSAYGPWTTIGACGTHGPVAKQACGPAWSADATYTSGDVVSRAAVNYTAQWWTRGEQPGTSPWGAWDEGLPCTPSS